MKTSAIAHGTAALVLALMALPVQAGEVLDRITVAGVIKVATDANWAPQSSRTDTASPSTTRPSSTRASPRACPPAPAQRSSRRC